MVTRYRPHLCRSRLSGCDLRLNEEGGRYDVFTRSGLRRNDGLIGGRMMEKTEQLNMCFILRLEVYTEGNALNVDIFLALWISTWKRRVE